METISYADKQQAGRTYIHYLCSGARLLLGVGEGEKQVARHLRVVFPVVTAACQGRGPSRATWMVHFRREGRGFRDCRVCATSQLKHPPSLRPFRYMRVPRSRRCPRQRQNKGLYYK